MAIQIQLRRGTLEQWAAANTVLAEGELAVELDTSQYKIGDGIRPWTDLPYGGIHGPTAGYDTQVIFNIGGYANASPSFTYDYSSNTLNLANNLVVSNTLTVSNSLIVSNNITVSNNLTVANTLVVENQINLSNIMKIGNNIIFSANLVNDVSIGLGPAITLGENVNSTLWYAPQGLEPTEQNIFFANASLIQVGNGSSYFNLTNESLSFLDENAESAGFISVKKIYANTGYGETGQVLSTNSTGGIFWGTALTNGSNTQVLFNDDSLTNGSAAFTYTKDSNTLNIENISANTINVASTMKFGGDFILFANSENGGGFEKIGPSITLGKNASNLTNGPENNPWYAPQGGTFATDDNLFFANASLIQVGNKDSYFNLYKDSLSFYDIDGFKNGSIYVNTISASDITSDNLSVLNAFDITDENGSVTINSTSFSGVSGSFSGTLNVTSDVTISGNLFVSGTTVYVNTQTLEVKDTNILYSKCRNKLE